MAIKLSIWDFSEARSLFYKTDRLVVSVSPAASSPTRSGAKFIYSPLVLETPPSVQLFFLSASGSRTPKRVPLTKNNLPVCLALHGNKQEISFPCTVLPWQSSSLTFTANSSSCLQGGCVQKADVHTLPHYHSL